MMTATNIDSIQHVHHLSDQPIGTEQNLSNGSGKSDTRERLSFVDFYPFDRNSSYVKSIFWKCDTYDDLIGKANQWLQQNHQWKVKTVESFLFDPVGGLGKMLVHSHHIQLQRQLFGVRLWICPRLDKQAPIQHLKTINLIPKIKITGNNHQMFIESKVEHCKTFSSLNYPIFESIEDLVQHLNEDLCENRHIGQILNIETIALPVKSDKWTVDAQNLEWPAVNVKGALFILRVHLNERSIKQETIEILDFVPKMETWNAPLAVPNIESFTNVMKRASSTLKQRKDQFRFVNCNTVSCPTNSQSANGQNEVEFIKTKKTFYPHSRWLNCEQSFSSKFVRIIICKAIDSMTDESSNPNILNCKIFIPSKRDLHLCQYQDMLAIKKKIESWFTQTDAEILSIETEVISSATTSISLTALIDTCLNLKKFPCDLLVIFKVYINGYYIEPFK